MRRYYDEIRRVAGNVVTIAATGVGNEELAEVKSTRGESLAQVIRIHGREVSLQVFSGTQGVSTDDRIYFSGKPMQVPFGEELLGRVLDGSARPRDGKPPVDAERIDIGSSPVNPVKRRMPDQMVHTGIPMIDIFNSLVESQKIPIFSVAGEPYNELLARVGLQAQADIIILGGMGLRHDDYLRFRETFESGGVLGRTIMFVHTAADPIVECLLVPDLCLAVGEQFALTGKKVLVLLTDMTAFSDALKEIAITMEQVPSNRGYPGDLYTQLARRYEKAVDFDGAGSLTVLACVTMPGNDVTHPVPDNTGYITEGQFYLYGGRIDPFGSLSRLKQQVNAQTRDDHRAVMDACIQLYADCREAREKRDMGFEISEWDRKLLSYGEAFEKQVMDLSVNIPLFDALDLCWSILANLFEPHEVGIRRAILDKHWPENVDLGAAEKRATKDDPKAKSKDKGKSKGKTKPKKKRKEKS